MTNMLLMIAAVILVCILAHRISDRVGLPALLLFMLLGMACGSDGIMKVSFGDYILTEQVCSIALIFIMFYGGFCTNWETARPVAAKAAVLSTAGVVLTALLTCAFCHVLLGFSFIESFLIGAVISSTDAASVFSILRSKKLSMKYGTASMLEIESGSNDPVAYMLTMIGLTLLRHDGTSVSYLVFAQIVYGAAIGVGIALGAVWILKRFHKVMEDGLETLFVIAVVLISYALPASIGGNGYLSVYLTGILLGNHSIRNKVTLVHFFDGITGLSQMVIFFLLGLLSFPHKIPGILIPAVLIALFLVLIARPLAVFILMLPARCSFRQCLLLSFAGLRGAASIVFAIMVIASGVSLESDLFHIVFFISLLSVSAQGTLLPWMVKKLDMADEEMDVSKTFTDYQEESAITLMRLFVPKGHNWEDRAVSQVGMPTGSLAMMIKRGEETIVPKGDTVIRANDSVILSVPAYDANLEVSLQEVPVDKNHKWCGKAIEELELPDEVLIALIKRGDENIIPEGKTRILEHDVLVMYD